MQADALRREPSWEISGLCTGKFVFHAPSKLKTTWHLKKFLPLIRDHFGTRTPPKWQTFLPLIWDHGGTRNLQKWYLGVVLGVPGASWENSGKSQGASWAPFGPSGKTLRAFGGALEPSWGFLGAFQEDFGRPRAPLGRSWEPFLAPGAAYRKPGPEKPVWEMYVGAL